jgi:hypothetical protein
MQKYTMQEERVEMILIHSVFVELLSFKHFVHTTSEGPNKGGALSTCNTRVELGVSNADIGGLRQCQMAPIAKMQDL